MTQKQFDDISTKIKKLEEINKHLEVRVDEVTKKLRSLTIDFQNFKNRAITKR